MRIMTVYNTHRHGGGSDEVAARTAELLRVAGHAVEVFSRDSALLTGWSGSVRAFVSGMYASASLKAFEASMVAFQPDVVHAHELYPLITPWIFRICKNHGVPALMHCHDYRISCPVATHFRDGAVCELCAQRGGWPCILHNCAGQRGKSLAYAARYAVAKHARLFTECIDRFMTPSRFAKDMLCRTAGLDPARVEVVGNPVRVQKKMGPDDAHGMYVAYAGRFETEKGYGVLLEAMRQAGIPLRVAGAASATLTGGEGVVYTGYLSGQNLAEFYRGARMVVVPSLAHETFGLVVAESLSCGTPVIVTDRGALAEVAGPGGVVAPAGDAAALRNAIVALWNDPDRCRQLGAAGREHVQRYSDQRYLEKLLAVYGDVML